MTKQLPAYDDLPVQEGAPPHSSWGVFGDDDQIGTINLLDRETIRDALRSAHIGKVFSLNWDLEQPDPPLAGRGAMTHTIHRSFVGTDDYYDNFYPQRSSQWDALSHVQHRSYGFYNNCSTDEITGRPGSRNGIDNWGRRGIVGRFVLADVAGHFERMKEPLDQCSSIAITDDHIAATLREENVALRNGDILLLRFGWTAWYQAATVEERELAARPLDEVAAPGLAHEERIARWLWDQHVAAVATDSPALEVLPLDETSMERFLHVRLIALLGMAIGEMFYLEALAADCAQDGIYDGLLVAAPLNKTGGSGSPANALAIK